MFNPVGLINTRLARQSRILLGQRIRLLSVALGDGMDKCRKCFLIKTDSDSRWMTPTAWVWGERGLRGAHAIRAGPYSQTLQLGAGELILGGGGGAGGEQSDEKNNLVSCTSRSEYFYSEGAPPPLL